MSEIIWERIVSLLFPRRCPVCDKIVPAGEGLIHEKCAKKMKPAGKCVCMKCGKPLRNSAEEYCRDCKEQRHFFDRGFSVFRYRSVSGSVYRFKYSGRREYADYYGEVTTKILGEKIREISPDVLVPIPMYSAKRRRRGYNQAEVLARSIGKRTGIPVDANLVKRTRNTVPMKMLDRRGRHANLKKAFNITGNDVKFKSIILIDDIYTTGSTIDAVSKELRKAGVENIFFITLAIGQVV